MDIENRLHIQYSSLLFFTGSNIPSNASYNSHCIWLWVFSTLCFACLCLFVALCSIAFYSLETGKATVMWCVQYYDDTCMYIWFVEVLCIWLIIYHIHLRADEDEEGDRITVRGDEELQAMINGVGFKITSISIIIIIIKSLLGILAHECCTKLKTCVSTWYHYMIVLLGLKHWIQTIDNMLQVNIKFTLKVFNLHVGRFSISFVSKP